MNNNYFIMNTNYILQGEWFSYKSWFILITLHIIDDVYYNIDAAFMGFITSLLVIYIGVTRKSNSHCKHFNVKESLDFIDVICYPLLNTFQLVILYVLIAKMNYANEVNMIIKLYSCLNGTLSLSFIVYDSVKRMFPKLINDTIVITLPKCRVVNLRTIYIRKGDVICFMFMIILGGLYLQSNHWLLSNLFSICIAITSISSLKINTLYNGIIFLILFAIYDVVFVFYTPIMNTIALQINSPMKIIFPTMKKDSFAIIGLGDIIIPGIYLSTLFHYDYSLNVQYNNKENTVHFSFCNFIYFHMGIIAYVLGIFFSYTAVILFHTTQPALIYIVPFCVFITLITFIIKRIFK